MNWTLLCEILDRLIQILLIIGILSVFLAKYNSKLKGFLKYGKTFEKLQRNETILNKLLNLTIPKVWFSHFYLLSLILSTINFTLVELNLHDYKFFLLEILKDNSYGLIPIEISRLVSFLILGHSLRRLSETLLMMDSQSKSKMNISHYLVGILFYSSLNIQLILNTNFNDTNINQDLNYNIILSVILFFLSSASQFLHHLHLSKLVKYTIPSFGLFKFLSCAHYFDEILIYLSILNLLKNQTMIILFLWVIINLSVSSIETKNYYKKTSNGKTAKWSIIPFIL